MHLCVLRGSQNKQRLFLFSALLTGFYNRGRDSLLRSTKGVFKSDTASSLKGKWTFHLSGLRNIYMHIYNLMIQVFP
jgi:hypothetical protein